MLLSRSPFHGALRYLSGINIGNMFLPFDVGSYPAWKTLDVSGANPKLEGMPSSRYPPTPTITNCLWSCADIYLVLFFYPSLPKTSLPPTITTISCTTSTLLTFVSGAYSALFWISLIRLSFPLQLVFFSFKRSPLFGDYR
jgi:hypothetical protein